MKAVLRNRVGYFSGPYRDKFDLERIGTSTELDHAVTFDVGVEDGRAVITPAPPEGDWDVVAVRVRTQFALE